MLTYVYRASKKKGRKICREWLSAMTNPINASGKGVDAADSKRAMVFGSDLG